MEVPILCFTNTRSGITGIPWKDYDHRLFLIIHYQWHTNEKDRVSFNTLPINTNDLHMSENKWTVVDRFQSLWIGKWWGLATYGSHLIYAYFDKDIALGIFFCGQKLNIELRCSIFQAIIASLNTFGRDNTCRQRTTIHISRIWVQMSIAEAELLKTEVAREGRHAVDRPR